MNYYFILNYIIIIKTLLIFNFSFKEGFLSYNIYYDTTKEKLWTINKQLFDNYIGSTINDDYTVDFIGNDAWATGGSGNYSPCTQVFDITLTQGLFTTSFTTQVVMSPN